MAHIISRSKEATDGSHYVLPTVTSNNNVTMIGDIGLAVMKISIELLCNDSGRNKNNYNMYIYTKVMQVHFIFKYSHASNCDYIITVT